jgi:putative transposase
MQEYLKRIVHQVTKFHPDIKILEVNTDLNHTHMMISSPPRYSISQVVQYIKSNTGRQMRLRYPWFNKIYFGTESIWSIGYFVSTVGIDEEIIKRYIENQGREDSGQAKLDI